MFDGPIRDHAYWTPRAPAVVLPDRIVSYAQFNADIDHFGAALIELGIVGGCGVVALAIRSGYLQYVALAALARLGVPSSTATDTAAARCLTDQRHNPDPRVIQLDPDVLGSGRRADPPPLPTLDLAPEALLRVLSSSGTTARPHRVPFSRQRIDANTAANLRVYGAGQRGVWVPLTGIDSLLGFSMTVLGWSQGVAMANGIAMSDLPDLIESSPEGLLGTTPAKLRELLTHLPAGFRPNPGWRIVVAGAALPAPLAREAMLRLTRDVRRQYGATESCQIAAGPASRQPEPPGRVGITPAGTVLQVVDPTGDVVPEGQSGEIRVRGERTAPGYLDDPTATAERFRQGWFHTGDIGHRQPDGTIVVEGRIDDRMTLASGKFMPGALEAPALECPGVLDCAAFAVPGPLGIDQCWLAVVTGPDFDRDSLAAHLAPYPGLPENRFAWTDEIPRNAMGKIERRKLRDALIAALADSRSVS